MGGISDYSGALVLQKPIKEKTIVNFSKRTDGLVIARTYSKEEEESVYIVEYQKLKKESAIDYDFAKSVFALSKSGTWAAYIIGCLLVLQKEKGIEVNGGEFEVRSEIPEGKGVSSSAALEIATMNALSKAYNLKFEGTEQAILAQIVENKIVGAPCGLMDQLSCAYGEPNTLLPIICQPDKIMPAIEIPNEMHFIGIDSGTRHHVGGASYSDVRKAAFMGYSIIANYLGITNNEIIKARQSVQKIHLPFKGYLSNISKKEWEEKLVSLLPNGIYGYEFIEKYESTIDPITTIIPEKFYNIKACTSHPVLENDRIKMFLEIMLNLNKSKNKRLDYEKMGEIMYKSHRSYSSVQLGSSGTDRLVEMVKAEKGNGVYGAKITGGGSGGTVCILAVGDQGLNTAHQIHKEYQKELEKVVKIFT
jgi:L-arabinokinase